MRQALVNARLLLDDGFVDGHAVLLEGGRIAAVVPADDATRSRRRRAPRPRRRSRCCPGFIDTQVNGGGGVLFNDAPSVETIRRIGAAHRRFGTTGFLPTLISDDLDVVARAIAATDAAIAAGVPGVIGIHIEGPFLNSARRGTHDPSKLRSLDASALQLLTSLRRGRTLVTLAPEVASAGHDPQARRGRRDRRRRPHQRDLSARSRPRWPKACAASRTCSTRCRSSPSASPAWSARRSRTGRAGAASSSTAVTSIRWCCGSRCAASRVDRFMLVTDAMPTVGADAKSFNLQGKPISVEDGVCVDEIGVLSGSDLDMAAAVRNAIAQLGVDLATAARMASLHPATFLGLEHELGRIAPGYRANLVAVDAAVHVVRTWIDGIGS